MPEAVTTRDRLLDAAEELFALNGYLGTSLRDITRRAQANLSAVKYHFGSKEGLAEAMIQRCLVPLNRQRLDILEAELSDARNAGRDIRIDALIRGLVEPVFQFIQSGPSGYRLSRIFCRLHTDSNDTIRKYFAWQMIPVFRRFSDAFQAASPHLPPETIIARLFFAIGAMGFGLHMIMGELPFKHADSAPLLPPIPDTEILVRELVGFATRGMEAASCQ